MDLLQMFNILHNLKHFRVVVYFNEPVNYSYTFIS
jgi:hypothetical protein